MESAPQPETLAPMTEPDLRPRINELNRRREEIGVSVERLSRQAGYKSEQTWRDLRNGTRPLATLEKFESALDWIEEHAHEPETTPVTSSPEGLIEFEVTGDFGVRVIVRGPVANAEELERAAAKIIRDIRGAQGPSDV
jgi:hypothetical protein